MNDIANDPRVTEATATQHSESRRTAASAVPVARLLANPRRVRRA